jgi:hypothetical protein
MSETIHTEELTSEVEQALALADELWGNQRSGFTHSYNLLNPEFAESPTHWTWQKLSDGSVAITKGGAVFLYDSASNTFTRILMDESGGVTSLSEPFNDGSGYQEAL